MLTEAFLLLAVTLRTSDVSRVIVAQACCLHVCKIARVVASATMVHALPLSFVRIWKLQLQALPVHGSRTEKLLQSALAPAADTTDTASSRHRKSVTILNRLQAGHSSSTQQHGESAVYLHPQRSQQVLPAPL